MGEQEEQRQAGFKRPLKLVRIGEAARRLGINEETLRRWQERGWIQPSYVEKSIRYYSEEKIKEIRRVMEEREEKYGTKWARDPITGKFTKLSEEDIPR